ncbi:MAG: hypothetical protein ACFB10_20260 [Salibacteraceae bacterium]
MEKSEQQQPFWWRFYRYQNERFPFLGHGLLVGAFTFSAISYSRICRGVEGFISLQDYAVGLFITLSLFFLLRIFDEFKDKEDDAKYRQYLPVPRGLIRLEELKSIGWIVGFAQLCVLGWFQPQMLSLYFLVMTYLLLMGVEFFVPKWLKARQIAYIASHMVIIPLVDLYASGLDWLLEGAPPHSGLVLFFVVSYLNGVVLEFGRKLRAPESEEPGVVSYTGLYGVRGGTIAWMGLLIATWVAVLAAASFAGYGWVGSLIFTALAIICLVPGFAFLRSPTPKKAKYIEYASALWTFTMYLGLGGIPMVLQLI